MSSLSTEFANSLYVMVLQKEAVFVGLYQGDPRRRGKEVSGGGYERTRAFFGPPREGLGATEDLVQFPVSSSPWGIVTHVGLHSRDGNLLFVLPLPSPLQVGKDEHVKFLPGDLSVGFV